MKLNYISFTFAIQLEDFGHNLNYFWNQTWYFLTCYHRLPYLVFLTNQIIKSLLLNSLLLLFKLNFHNSRRDKVLCFNELLSDITKVKKWKKSSFSSTNGNNQVWKKWKMTDQKIVVWKIFLWQVIL